MTFTVNVTWGHLDHMPRCEHELVICSRCNNDHKADGSGLDDGPYLPGRAPRKQAAKKTPAELAAIRAKAWATRRRRNQ